MNYKDVCNRYVLTTLEGADLSGANLEGANLKRQIRTLQTNRWAVVFCGDRIQIGCKNYSIEEWSNFSDSDIEGMEYRALDWWRVYKRIVLDLATKQFRM